jgi:hypothetical protein
VANQRNQNGFAIEPATGISEGHLVLQVKQHSFKQFITTVGHWREFGVPSSKFFREDLVKWIFLDSDRQETTGAIPSVPHDLLPPDESNIAWTNQV